MARICFFNSTRFWGGGEKWHFETAEHLASRGHQVMGIVHPNGALRRRFAERSIIETIPLKVTNLSFLDPVKSIRLIHLFRSRRIQTVVFNGSSDVKLGAPAARAAGVRAAVYRRGLGVAVRNSALNRFLYGRMVTHFLTNSQATAEKLFQDLTVPNASEKTRTIYNGIDLTQFRTGDDRRRAQGPLVIGTAGRLEAEKGHHHLLSAARRLKDQGLDFQLLIAGDGGHRTYLSDQIQRLELNGKVHLLGFVSDMPRFLQTLDLFVFPSRWEGFGYATAEAMAAGRPVVAFDVGSNREVVEDRVTGYLVPAGDVDSLSEKIMQLAENPDLRAKMGLKARERVCEKFDQTRQLRKLECYLCREVIDRKP